MLSLVELRFGDRIQIRVVERNREKEWRSYYYVKKE